MAKSRILGPDGQPIERSVLTEKVAMPTITGIRSILSDHPSRGLTPGRLAELLLDSERGNARAYLELAEDMEEKDLHYRAVINTRKLCVAQLEVTVDAASDDAEDQANAELVREVVEALDLETTIFDMQDGIAKGYSATEICWDTSEGEWRPTELLWREPKWFRIDYIDGQTIRLFDGSQLGIDLPPFKFLLHKPKTKSGIPLRGGLARAAAWSFLFKNMTIKDWVIFAEVYGQPLRVGKFGPEANDKDKAALLAAVRNIGSDAAAIIPQAMLIEFIETGQKGVDLWERLANFLDQQVSKAVLGQTTTTDAISGGHAVSQEHQEVREDIERADAKGVAGTINRDLVRPLIDLNRGPPKKYPLLRIGRQDQVNVPELATALAQLVPLGLKVGMSTVRDKIGMPDPADDEELMTAPKAPAPAGVPPIGADPNADPGAVALQAAGAGRNDVVDAFTARLAAEAGTSVEHAVTAIASLMASASSLQDFRDRLVELYPRISPTSFAEVMARAVLASDLAGRYEATR